MVQGDNRGAVQRRQQQTGLQRCQQQQARSSSSRAQGPGGWGVTSARSGESQIVLLAPSTWNRMAQRAEVSWSSQLCEAVARLAAAAVRGTRRWAGSADGSGGVQAVLMVVVVVGDRHRSS